MRFNLEDYETVEERIKRFYDKYEDGRITTEWQSSYAVDGESPNIWVLKASVFLTAGDQANNLPKATGYAFEVDGGVGANKTAAMENAETSAIGRSLANMGMSGNKRASREEMQKVARGESKPRDWIAEASKLNDVDELRLLWGEAKAAKAPQKTLDSIKELANGHSDSERKGVK